MNGIEERVDDIIAKDGGISLKSFEIQRDLNRDFWNKQADNRLFPEIRIALLNIAQDFLESLSLDEVLDKNKFVDPNNLLKDVLFLGSLASYNYSSYSDVDLHLLVDLSLLKLTADQEALVKSYFNLKKNDWNAKHSHLLVKGHDVELYVQDVNEENAANGIYSLVQDRWLKLPVRMPDHSFSEKQVKSKAMWYITRIDHLAEMLDRENLHSWDVQKIHDICQQIKDKIIKARRASLNGVSKATRNEMCEPNLVFKVLRRTGHIGKLNDLIDRSYDLAKSLVEEELTVGLGVVEDCCCVSALGGDGFGDGMPALTKGDYHLPAILTQHPLKRYARNDKVEESKMKKINENTKVTLTFNQLKRLVKESNVRLELGRCVWLFFEHCAQALEDVPEKTVYRAMSSVSKALHDFGGGGGKVDSMLRHYVDVCNHKPSIQDNEKRSTVELFFKYCCDSVSEHAFGDAYDELGTGKQVDDDMSVYKLLRKIRNIVARNGGEEHGVGLLDWDIKAFRDASANADEAQVNESAFGTLEQYLAKKEAEFKPSHTNPSWDESEDKIWAVQEYLSSMGEFTDEDRAFLKEYDPELLELEDDEDESSDLDEEEYQGDGILHVFDYGEDCPFSERYVVVFPSGEALHTSGRRFTGAVSYWDETGFSYSTKMEMEDNLTVDWEGEEVVPHEVDDLASLPEELKGQIMEASEDTGFGFDKEETAKFLDS